MDEVKTGWKVVHNAFNGWILSLVSATVCYGSVIMVLINGQYLLSFLDH